MFLVAHHKVSNFPNHYKATIIRCKTFQPTDGRQAGFLSDLCKNTMPTTRWHVLSSPTAYMTWRILGIKEGRTSSAVLTSQLAFYTES